MKKLLLFSLAIFPLVIQAQTLSGSHLKMSDLIQDYKTYEQPFRNNQNEPEHKRTGLGNRKFPERLENKDYHFDRWKWYWQQHLDANGYLVSPVKTYNSWKVYQEQDAVSRLTSTSGANWTFQGDDSSGADGSGVGRINVIAFHPTLPNTYWIGSPGGGAWKTTNNGVSWTNMTNQLPVLAVSDIKFNPANPNTIYLCTGDKDGGDFYSVGLLKSYNGGTTWNTTGITYAEDQFHMANAILVNPLDTNSLIFASDTGIYRSFNGGTTWIGPVALGNFLQIVYHPTDTSVVYATTFRNPHTGGQGQIFRSANGGMTWTQISHFTDAARISLAVSPADVKIVKAIVAATDFGNLYGLYGVYNSTDTGHTFTEIFTPASCGSGSDNLLSYSPDGTGCGGQADYDLTLAMDPTNPNNVYCGGVNTWRSTDGGTSWETINQWDSTVIGVVVIHADKHFMSFHPLVPGRFFETNDGGIYWSDNPTATGVWNNVTNGLGITEFYRMAASGLSHYVLGGAQDVGTKAMLNALSVDVDGGDGMECQIDPVDTTYLYASTYYGSIDLLNTIAGFVGTISNNVPGTPMGGWVTPYVLEPACNTCLLAGYQNVFRSTDRGTSWTDISGALTTNDLLRVVTTLADANTVYAAEDGSNNLYYTHNRGATSWTTLAAPYSGQNISDVIIDPRNAHQVWVAFSGYRAYGSPQIAAYNDVSNAWTSFNANLPDVPVNCLQMDQQNRTLYAGTDVGVFYRDTTMTQWQPFTTGMPAVSVTDLQFDYTKNKMWAATFGRSLWTSTRHVPGPSAIANVPTEAESISIFPNPNHGSFNVSVKNAAVGSLVTINILDNLGRVMWRKDAIKNSAIQINTAGIAAGAYIIEASGNEGIIGRSKIVIY